MESQKKAVTGRPHKKEELWASIAGSPVAETPANDCLESTSTDGNVTPEEVTATREVATEVNTAPKKKAMAASIEDISSDTSSQLTLVEPSAESINTQLIEVPARFPNNLAKNAGLFLGQNGRPYLQLNDTPNPVVVVVGSKKANNLIRQLGQREGVTLRKSDLNDINHILQAEAETAGKKGDVWYRVAPICNGVEIDLGDEQHTRVRIAEGKVDVVAKGSDTYFFRTQVSKPMVLPAAVGNLNLLKKYLNLHPVQMLLFTAWVSYTLAHPKVPTSKFVIMVLQGNQGSGKSFLCWIILMLLDPSILGVQLMPSNPKDLSIAAQNAHVLCYDNMREITQSMSDVLCTAATGGVISNRQLYTDSDLNVLQLHVTLVLNGIHSFVDQPDLAQRCLPLTLLPFNEGNRKSESQLTREFLQDLPAIMRGLFDLIAKIFTHLPTARITNSERMIDFVHWLAAMEQVDGENAGRYQALYSDVLKQGQLDTILDNPLAAVVMDFAHEVKGGAWTGTPTDLMSALNKMVSPDTKRSKEWPQNSIALSKRLHPLEASLRTQGVTVEFARGKERTISIVSTHTNSKKTTEVVENDEY